MANILKTSLLTSAFLGIFFGLFFFLVIIVKRNFAEFYYHKALKDTKHFERKIQNFSRAIRLDPNNPVFYYKMGKSYLEKAKKIKKHRKDYLKLAQLNFQKAVDLAPANPKFQRRLVYTTYKLTKNTVQYFHDLETIKDLDPANKTIEETREKLKNKIEMDLDI